jgi:hypothetical protein
MFSSHKEMKMPFEAKQLRVQLPCGSVTVMESGRYDAEMAARRLSGWADIISGKLSDPSCGPGTSCGFHSGFSTADVAHLCHGSDPIDVKVVIDVAVLPALRLQLEARLKELDAAEKAVSRAMGTQKKS